MACPDDEIEFEQDWDLDDSCGYDDGEFLEEGSHEVDPGELCMR